MTLDQKLSAMRERRVREECARLQQSQRVSMAVRNYCRRPCFICGETSYCHHREPGIMRAIEQRAAKERGA